MSRPCLYTGCDGQPARDEWDRYFCSETCAALWACEQASEVFDECDSCGELVEFSDDFHQCAAGQQEVDIL